MENKHKSVDEVIHHVEEEIVHKIDEELLEEQVMPIVPAEQVVYGNIVEVITIISCILALIAPIIIILTPANSMLNANLLFGQIFSKAKPAEIWAQVPGGFPGGHFYFTRLFTNPGESIAQIAIALGCSVSLWALIPSLFVFIKKKNFIFVVFCLVVMAMIVLALSGILKVE